MKPIRVALAMVMLFALAACDVGEMLISPDPGEIVDTSTVTVTGQIPIAAEPGGSIDVNGVAGPFTDPAHWEATIPVSPAGYVTVIHATPTATTCKISCRAARVPSCRTNASRASSNSTCKIKIQSPTPSARPCTGPRLRS